MSGSDRIEDDDDDIHEYVFSKCIFLDCVKNMAFNSIA